MIYGQATGTHNKTYTRVGTEFDVVKFTAHVCGCHQAFGTATGAAFVRGTTAGTNEWQMGTIAANPSNQWRFSVRPSDAVLYTAIWTTNIVLRATDMATGVLDGSNIYLWVNKQLRATTACTVTMGAATTNIRALARSDDTNPLDAWVGRVGLWNEALSPGDIIDLHNGTPPWLVRPSTLVIGDDMYPGGVDVVRGRGTVNGPVSYPPDPSVFWMPRSAIDPYSSTGVAGAGPGPSTKSDFWFAAAA